MIEDKLLIMRFKYGSQDALRRIYSKYRTYLLKVACALLNDAHIAEDVVHEVFLGFAKSADNIKLEGSLKSYLRACVVNNIRNIFRTKNRRQSVGLDEIAPIADDSNKPHSWITYKEQSARINNALAQIPFEQREVIVLHLLGDMKFRHIAQLQSISIKTVQSRYRYGLDKLKVLLDSEVKNETD